MKNPFEGRVTHVPAVAKDMVPVTPSDSADLENVVVGLYIEGAGAVTFVSYMGKTRTVNVPEFSVLQCGVRRVLATGTTATGIHALDV